MGTKRLLFVLSIVFLLVVLLAAACASEAPIPAPGATSASPPPAAAPAKPTKLRMAMPAEPPSGVGGGEVIGSMHAFNNLAQPILYNVMEPLVLYTKDGPVGRLATKWEPSADLTTWRFYLRKGVKFHNGDDFTARDVVEFAKWIIEQGKATTLYKAAPLKDAVAADDYTVDLVFATPQPLFLINAGVFLIPPLAYSRDNRKMYQSHPVGTGPYRFVEWNRGQNIKLTRFEGYWGPKPQIDEVQIIFRAEEGVRLAALQAGEVDWAYALSPESASRAPKVVRMASPETVTMRYDEFIQKEFGGESILADKRLRLAVEYAIDRKALVSLLGGFATPSLGQYASPGEFGFNPNIKSRSYDLEQARALVREAGAIGKAASIVIHSGRWVKDREVGQAIANMIEQTGLKVKLMAVDPVEWVKYILVSGENRQHNADIVIGPQDAPLEVESRYPDFFIRGGNKMAIADPEPTKLFSQVVTETDYAKRGEKLAEAWAYVYEQAHYVPVFKLEWIWGVAKNLEWRPDIAGRPFVAEMRFTD